jgi:hypothetical protein
MLMTCCAYSYKQYTLRTQYMFLTNAEDLLCLQLHTVHSPFSCTLYSLHTDAHNTVSIQLHTVQSPYSCTLYSLHTTAHCTFSTSFTISRFPFHQTVYISLIQLKYKLLFIFPRSKCHITSYSQILKPQKLICVQ